MHARDQRDTVREGLARNDYEDPGYFEHPKGTVAREVTNDLPPVK